MLVREINIMASLVSNRLACEDDCIETHALLKTDSAFT